MCFRFLAAAFKAICVITTRFIFVLFMWRFVLFNAVGSSDWCSFMRVCTTSLSLWGARSPQKLAPTSQNKFHSCPLQAWTSSSNSWGWIAEKVDSCFYCEPISSAFPSLTKWGNKKKKVLTLFIWNTFAVV